MLKAGDRAPAFHLASTGGGTISSAGLTGRKYVLYFYPKDDTPGCTREACDFRDNLGRLRKAGVEVFGVSRDTLASHRKFREKYGLPFDLLSDEDNSVARAYGAFGEKILYGKKTVGTIRSTYLIDEEGRVAAVWPKVKVEGHLDEILEQLAGGAKKPSKKRALSPSAGGAKRVPRREALGVGPQRTKKK